ncbi:MAG: hypothetical protein HRT61_20785 [Ekhidna sp.]|nr:hypothetical protein [Ekhidna sp.]
MKTHSIHKKVQSSVRTKCIIIAVLTVIFFLIMSYVAKRSTLSNMQVQQTEINAFQYKHAHYPIKI